MKMTNNKEPKSKKMKKKKTKQSQDIDDDDAYLEAIIAENSKDVAQFSEVDHASVIVNLF